MFTKQANRPFALRVIEVAQKSVAAQLKNESATRKAAFEVLAEYRNATGSGDLAARLNASALNVQRRSGHSPAVLAGISAARAAITKAIKQLNDAQRTPSASQRSSRSA